MRHGGSLPHKRCTGNWKLNESEAVYKTLVVIMDGKGY